MSNLNRFKRLLETNDFELPPSPEVHVPPGTDDETASNIRRRALAEMRDRNFHCVRKFAREHAAVLEELCDLYVTASPDEQREMRHIVASEQKWQDALLWWDFSDDRRLLDVHPERYVELLLGHMSLMGGDPDPRNTLVTLGTTWCELEERGIDPEPHYRTAREWGGSLGYELGLVLDPALRPGYSLIQPGRHRPGRKETGSESQNEHDGQNHDPLDHG